MTPRSIQIDFKAYEKRQKNEVQMIWLQGLYFRSALSSTPVAMGMAKGELPKYAKMPYEEEQKEEMNEETLQKQREMAFYGFVSLIKGCNKERK